MREKCIWGINKLNKEKNVHTYNQDSENYIPLVMVKTIFDKEEKFDALIKHQSGPKLKTMKHVWKLKITVFRTILRKLTSGNNIHARRWRCPGVVHTQFSKNKE